MIKRVHFPASPLPYLLVAPQIVITIVFFLWPAGQAFYQSFRIEDAFGLGSEFVWFENFEVLFTDPLYLAAFWRTILFSALVAVVSMGTSLVLAAFADRVIRGATFYRTLLIWPYAIAPVLAGAIWSFMFHPTLGIFPYFLEMAGIDWNHYMSGNQAMALVVLAASWKQIAYNFLFYLAGMQAIPKSVIEAAAIDGAGPVYRFRTIILPLLSPTTFFLLIINAVYAFFDTFGIIHAVTKGGPASSTTTLVYKVFTDGFIGLDLGGSAAQSIVLMLMVIALTVFQFRYIERKVEY